GSTSPRNANTITPALAVIAIASSDVAVATRSGRPTARMSSGTATIPPPTPKNAENSPAARPMATSRTGVSYERDQSGRSAGPPPCVRRIRRDGRRRSHAAEGDGDVPRTARQAAVPEPCLRRLLGCARERGAHAVRQRAAGRELLRGAHGRPLRAPVH